MEQPPIIDVTLSDGFRGAPNGFFAQLRGDAPSPSEPVADVPDNIILPSQPDPATPDKSAEPEDDTPAPTLKKPSELKKGIEALLGDEPAAEEKRAAEPEDEGDAPTDATTPEAKGAWKNIKKEVRELKQERERLAKELEAAKSIKDSDPIKSEAEALRRQVDELRDKLVKYDFREDPKYVSEIGKPLETAKAQIAKLAKATEIDVGAIEDAIYQSDEAKFLEKLDAAIESLPASRQAMLTNAAVQVRDLELKAVAMEQQAGEFMKAANEEKSKLTEKQRTESRAAEMRAVADLEPVLKKVAAAFSMDGEEPDAAVKAILSEAQQAPFDELGASEKAFSVAAAAMVPRMREKISYLEKQLALKDRAISRYTGAAPKTGSGAPIAATAPNAEPTSFFKTFFGKGINEY